MGYAQIGEANRYINANRDFCNVPSLSPLYVLSVFFFYLLFVEIDIPPY